MKKELFEEFLKIAKLYELKRVPRDNTNKYFDEKDDVFYNRRETVAEHVYSSLKLADFFLSFKEFNQLNKLKIFEILLYHDDVEIITGDEFVISPKKKKEKEKNEMEALDVLKDKTPINIKDVLEENFKLYLKQSSEEAKFAKAIDKLDSLIQELAYPESWKNYTLKEIREWNEKPIKEFKILKEYFDTLLSYLEEKEYLKKSQ